MSLSDVTDHYGVDTLPQGTFPLRYNIIDEYQKQDKELVKGLKERPILDKVFSRRREGIFADSKRR